MSFVVCLPALDPGWAKSCIASLDPEIRQKNLLVVDNTQRGLQGIDVWRVERHGFNLGVAGSWNRGVAAMEEVGATHITLLSEATVFTDGGASWFKSLETVTDCLSSLTAWHLVGFSAECIRTHGLFDENFYPAYMEDTDYIRRMTISGSIFRLAHNIDTAWSVKDRGTAHCVIKELVQVNFGELSELYRAKWGGNPGAETFATPYGLDVPLSWWPQPKERPCASA